MAQVDTNFPKVRRMLFYVSPLRPILKFWSIDEDHLGKSFQAMDFGFRMLACRNTALVNRTHRIDFSMIEPCRKIVEDFGGSIS